MEADLRAMRVRGERGKCTRLAFVAAAAYPLKPFVQLFKY